MERTTSSSSWWTAAFALGLVTTSTAHAGEPEVTDHPLGTYVRVDDPDALVDDVNPQEANPHLLYLNRCAGGLTIYPGNGGSIADESQIVGGTINFPPFPYGDTAWNDVVDRARNIFSPFNITVTDVDPGNTTHDMAVVCGDGAMAGFAGAGGVAPFSCGVITNAITFTFAQTLGNNPQLIAEVIGQEAAHAWGLDHEYLCQDPMTYLSGCGAKTFQNTDAPCGEYSQRACQCGGNTQNSYQHIMNTFGASTPDTQAPTAEITYPHDGDVFAPGSEFEITVNATDDVQVDQVTLLVGGTAQNTDSSAPFGPWPVSNIPEGTYVFSIEVVDVAGNTTESADVTIYVTNGDPPPAGTSTTAGSDGGGSDGGGGSSDGGLDGGGSGDAGADASADGGAPGAGALPPGYGTGFGPFDNGGCDCRAAAPGWSGGGAGTGLMLLGLLGLRRFGRRRRAR